MGVSYQRGTHVRCVRVGGCALGCLFSTDYVYSAATCLGDRGVTFRVSILRIRN